MLSGAGKAARKFGCKTQVGKSGFRAVGTTKKLLKPVQTTDQSSVQDIDDQIKAAAEQLANLRKARTANKQHETRLKSTHDDTVAAFLQKQQAAQLGAGAESALEGLTSITSIMSLGDTEVRQPILSRRSAGFCKLTSQPANFDHRKSRVEDAKASMQHHVFSWLDWSPHPSTACYHTLHEAFPGALPGPAVHRRVSHYLQNHYAFTPENTLFGLSICPDEINNQKGGLANLMGDFWGEIFPLGGIGGAPFVGKTGFSAFSHHVPDDGNILILYGPHVAISQEGEVGKYLREGQTKHSTACGAVIGAYQANCGITEAFEETEIDDCDMQMAWLRAQLLPHTDRIREQADPLAELSYQAYEIVRTKIQKIVSTKFGKGYLVLLGGIQLNMPFPYADHFLPMSFEIMRADEATGGMTNCGDLMEAFKCELTQDQQLSGLALSIRHGRNKAENLEGS